jgi:DNA replication protein
VCPPFAGFPAGKVHNTPIPAPVFQRPAAEIDDLAELKVTLYALWFLDQQEGTLRYLTYEDFAHDTRLLNGLDRDHTEALCMLEDGLRRAVGRGTLLQGLRPGEPIQKTLYFLNSPRGRAGTKPISSMNGRMAMQHMLKSRWRWKDPTSTGCMKRILAR